MLINILTFVLSSLPVFVGFKLYDVYRTRWRYAHEPKLKEKLSKTWHAIGFWMVLITVLIMAWHTLPLEIIIRFGPLACVLGYIIYDVAWNLFNDEGIWYPGNGGGSFMELFYSWLADKVGFDLTFWTYYTKFLLLVGSLIWAYKHNL